jgi:DNA-binding LacI/PurR family transcriptional regulator
VEAAATEQMASRLLALGHRRLTFVSPPQPTGTTGRRYRRGRYGTLRRVVDAAGGTLTVAMVDPLDGFDDGVATLVRALEADRPTAVVCASQLLTPWILTALHTSGRCVPKDVSVVAYGDSDWAIAHQPSLSVIARDTFAEGRELATRLFAEIDGDELPPMAGAEAQFIERASCAATPRRAR